MPNIVRPILIGGGWGIAFGAAATAAAVLGPILRPTARRALDGYIEAAARARESAMGAAASARLERAERPANLQDLHEDDGEASPGS